MKRLIIIAGPTAAGKTALSIELAKHLDAEIFNADSRQVYRKLDIGTAKPTSSELSLVNHHFIDIKNPDEYYSAGQYERDILAALTTYFKKKETAILVGGSGLYIKAVTDGLDNLPRDQKVREKWQKLSNDHGNSYLIEALAKMDPKRAESIDSSNTHRLIRALEIAELTQVPYNSLDLNKSKKRTFEILKFYLAPSRESLYERINNRVDQMMEDGLLDEFKSLVAFREQNALQTVGYAELFEMLDGNIDLETAIEKIKQHTRNYAKRQMTWFRKQEGYTAVATPELGQFLKHLKQLNVV